MPDDIFTDPKNRTDYWTNLVGPDLGSACLRCQEIAGSQGNENKLVQAHLRHCDNCKKKIKA